MSDMPEPLEINCPRCGATCQWSPANASRPFCSERCKNNDFVAWANEEHAIPGDPDWDELLSGDLDKG